MDGIVWALYGLMAATLAILTTALFAAIARVDALRTETRTDLAGFRAEARSDLADFRAEVRAEFADLHVEVRELRDRLTTAGG